MKNAILVFLTSVLGSFAANWIFNELKINIPSDMRNIIFWTTLAAFVFLLVIFFALPRMVRGIVRWRKDMERAARDEELEHF